MTVTQCMVASSGVVLRGREFSQADIGLIHQIIHENPETNRTGISRLVCEALNWRQPNGWLKDRACREVLTSLESRGLVRLPPAQIRRKSSDSISQVPNPKRIPDTVPLIFNADDLEVLFVKSGKVVHEWNRLVDQYHYLGHKVTVGRHIKYLVKSQESIVAAASFSSASWNVAARDSVLHGLGIEKSQVRDLVINNSRFLIPPYVEVPNLASRVLAILAKHVVVDWEDYYSIKPMIAETFVQESNYLGTCYKAANWVKVGYTSGYRKSGSSHSNGQEPKAVYLYGLDRAMRVKLSKLS